MAEDPTSEPRQPPIAEVALNLPVQKTFHYLIPDRMRGRLQEGSRVRVPFGNRSGVLGYCVGLLSDSPLAENRLKPIQKCLDAEPLLTPVLLKLARWMADYYWCGLGEALHAALPRAVRTRREARKLQFACLQISPEEAEELAEEIFEKRPAQSRILRGLAATGGEAPLAEILKSTSASRSSSKALARRDIVRIEKRAVDRNDPLSDLDFPAPDSFELTAEQRVACQAVAERLSRDAFDVVLLHGITSSGKTEVYIRSIERVVKAGRQAIVLVPEISLTPQTVRRFGARFGRMAVLHSRLTQAERRQQWKTIRRGEADVVIGARSAIFAPVPQLGLLVIDEEHENSFKQDSAPRYHARDVGVMRAKMEEAVVVLGSATPSLESYHNSRIGKYAAVRLSERIGGHPLPPVEVVDMRQEWGGHRRIRVLSRRLQACMRESLENGEKVILFINRRGFAPYIHCPRCGYVLKCPRCDITLNYHRRIDAVECHYCGHQQRPPSCCPECGLDKMRFSGTGTEKTEAAVADLFPRAATIRMDSDTTRARQAHRQKLEAFAEQEVSILIGTQMVAKGLDIPEVTTVGVVNADVALHLPDFRSRERTFQLLAQVAGRTGRGPAGGRVIVQTFMPEEPSIRAAAGHDYEEFAGHELPLRRELSYPPFGRLVRIICRGRKLEPLEQFSGELGRAVRKLCGEAGDGSQVLGPAPAPISQMRGRHRRHLLIKAPDAGSVRGLLAECGPLLQGPSGVKVVVDVDPVSMM